MADEELLQARFNRAVTKRATPSPQRRRQHFEHKHRRRKMSARRIATFAISAFALALLSGQAFASWGQALHAVRAQDLSSVIKVQSCSPGYVSMHHQKSSNRVCVIESSVLKGGPKYKAPYVPIKPQTKKEPVRVK